MDVSVTYITTISNTLFTFMSCCLFVESFDAGYSWLHICFLENYVSEVSDCYLVLFAVHGVEYAFRAHDYLTSGVFEVEPRQCPAFWFRRSILLGTTCLDPIQVRQFIELQSVNYNGDTYHLITKNCNHFCKDMCYKLTGNKISKWVNRLARIGIIALYLHLFLY
jgi:hypothetical protein